MPRPGCFHDLAPQWPGLSAQLGPDAFGLTQQVVPLLPKAATRSGGPAPEGIVLGIFNGLEPGFELVRFAVRRDDPFGTDRQALRPAGRRPGAGPE